MSSEALLPVPDDLVRHAGDLFLGLLRNELIGVYVIQDKVFRHVNGRFAEMFGYRQEDICGKMGPLDLTAPEDRVLAAGEVDRRLSGATSESHYTFRGLQKGGAILDLEVFGVRTELDGRAAIIGILLDITERKRAEETIWRQANYDPLTGLPNRRLFLDRLQWEMRKAHRSGESLALFFVDLDRFKEVNDNLGHEVGDLLLVEAARRIEGCVRESDTVARQGGDEFTLILPDLSRAPHVEHAAAGILRELAKPFRIGPHTAYVSASIGITLYPRDAQTVDGLLKNADHAMYDAKDLGRNRFSYFTASMQASALARLEMGNDLREALAAGQLDVHFQPIVALTSGKVTKAEALLRWQHPVRGPVSPADFVPIAEDLGLIEEIGDWVFRKAATVARRWRERHAATGGADGEQVQIAVNKSPRQFASASTHRSWVRHLAEIGLPGDGIAIEITERLLLDENPGVMTTLDQLRLAGMQISLDDFGTGYSAMAYLKRFHIDYLKIDQSFVRDVTTDSSDRAIAEAIIVMAHKLGLKVVAEGVETAAQRDLLLAAGCDFGQGYLFARPMPAEAFLAWLDARLSSPPASSPIQRPTPQTPDP